MSRRQSGRKSGGDSARAACDAQSLYWRISKRPIQVLVFLLPLVVYYEVAMVTILSVGGSSSQTYTNHAHKTLLLLFDRLGVHASGWYVPGAALVVVMLAWQALSRDPWRIDVRAMGLMALEAAALTLPILVLGQLVARLASGTDAMPAFVPAESDHPVSQLSIAGRIAFSVGAGLYEELAFRMLVLGLLHALLVDVGGMPPRGGTAIAVAVSALLFMAYHWLGVGAGELSLAVNAFYFASGLYFGLVFVVRGFGLVVAVHALYDIVTSVFLLG